MRTMNNISAHNVITEHRLLRGGVPAVAGGGCVDEGVDMCHVGFSSITIFLSRVPWLGILVSNLPNHHDGYSCSNRQTIFKYFLASITTLKMIFKSEHELAIDIKLFVGASALTVRY